MVGSDDASRGTGSLCPDGAVSEPGLTLPSRRGRRPGHAHERIQQEPERSRSLLSVGKQPPANSESGRGEREVRVPRSTAEGGELAPSEDPLEGRRHRSQGPPEGKTVTAPPVADVSTRLRRIQELAGKARTLKFRTLAHHIDVDLLREANRKVRKSGAVGVDQQSGYEYGENLEKNLSDLLARQKSGTYRAPPVRRVYIPKGDGTTRPIGMPTFEDKLLQRAVVMLLNAVYLGDFYDFSYGFIPGRSAHQALEALRRGISKMGGGTVLDVDLKSFFDSLDHKQLRRILDQRVQDRAIRQLIDKWLNAGVFEAGAVRYNEFGTPQGGVISPLLANIFLHAALDTWFVETIQPKLVGKAFMVRYADDFVVVFSRQPDAKRVLRALKKRMSEFGLTVHPDKTRLVKFKRPNRRALKSGMGSFDFLGFTHTWQLDRDSEWVLTRSTAHKRFSRSMQGVAGYCRKHRHEPIEAQQEALNAKLRGHQGYYGLPDNLRALSRYRHFLQRMWHFWLNRRSQRRALTWAQFDELLQRHPLIQPYDYGPHRKRLA